MPVIVLPRGISYFLEDIVGYMVGLFLDCLANTAASLKQWRPQKGNRGAWQQTLGAGNVGNHPKWNPIDKLVFKVNKFNKWCCAGSIISEVARDVLLASRASLMTSAESADL